MHRSLWTPTNLLLIHTTSSHKFSLKILLHLLSLLCVAGSFQMRLDLKMMFKNPLRRENTVNVPPMMAQMDVTNSYHRLPLRVMRTAMALKS